MTAVQKRRWTSSKNLSHRCLRIKISTLAGFDLQPVSTAEYLMESNARKEVCRSISIRFTAGLFLEHRSRL